MAAGGPAYNALYLSNLKTGKASVANGEKPRPLYQGKDTELHVNPEGSIQMADSFKP